MASLFFTSVEGLVFFYNPLESFLEPLVFFILHKRARRSKHATRRMEKKADDARWQVMPRTVSYRGKDILVDDWDFDRRGLAWGGAYQMTCARNPRAITAALQRLLATLPNENMMGTPKTAIESCWLAGANFMEPSDKPCDIYVRCCYKLLDMGQQPRPKSCACLVM